MPKSLQSTPYLSLLTKLLPEPDPIEDTKHRINSITLIVWFIHQWQQRNEEEEGDIDIVREIKEEVSLTKLQLSIIGQVTKQTPEPEVLRLVTQALDYQK